MNSDLGRYFGTAEGVLVIRAPADSRLGLKGGDVVVSVDGRPVASPGQLIRILGSYEGEEQFRMEVMRMKKKETVQGKVGE
jgi:S1-C subfamily serine protease